MRITKFVRKISFFHLIVVKKLALEEKKVSLICLLITYCAIFGPNFLVRLLSGFFLTYVISWLLFFAILCKVDSMSPYFQRIVKTPLFPQKNVIEKIVPMIRSPLSGLSTKIGLAATGIVFVDPVIGSTTSSQIEERLSAAENRKIWSACKED